MIHFFPLAMVVTNFGESVVVLSTATAVSAWFWLSRQRELAVLWLLALGGCAVTMVALKIGFLTCGHFVFDGTVRTPSGHSSMAALFYGAAALTIGRISPPAAKHRHLMLAAAFLFALIIGLSRVVIHAHTPQEVVVGLSVGFAWLAGFALLLRRVRPSAEMPPTYVLLLLGLLYGGLLTLTMVGEHMTLEKILWHVAHLLHTRWDVCVG
jgi:membrane-associated phospholipid phosphatase